MALKEARALFRFDEWATNRLLDSLSRLAKKQFRKELGSSLGAVRGTLVHIYGADRLWLD